MNKKTAVLVMIFAAFFLAGCFHDKETTEKPKVDTASINVTLQGTLSPANASGEYSLQTTQGLKLLHDGNASLAGYEGQTIRVTGQYSGTTLYVDQVEVIQ